MDEILQTLYLFLPAYIANMAPVIAGKLKLPLGTPVHEKALGKHKTWRGLIAGYIAALLVLIIQFYLQKSGSTTSLNFFNYQQISLPHYALILGGGALFGDMLKSFFKRRLSIKPGRPWPPFDQIDLVVGVIIFALPFFTFSLQQLVVLFVATPILSLTSNIVAYHLGMKKVWW